TSTSGHTEDGSFVGDKCVRIGDADTLLRGQKQYVITYDLVCHEDDDVSADYLSIDLFPTGWMTSVREAEILLKLPKAVDPSAFQFFAGEYGETMAPEDFPDNYTLSVSDSGSEIRMHVTDNPAYSGVTLKADLPGDYWEGAKSNRFALILFVILLIACPAAAAILWFLFGCDPEIVKTVEFEPPDDMTPAELGYVIDGYVDKGDMSSMLMYFAGRGYLGIHEKKKNSYAVQELKNPKYGEEKEFARTLFNGIFSGAPKTKREGADIRTRDLKKMPADYGKSLQRAQSQLEKYYKKENALYTEKSTFSRGISILLVMANIIFAVVLSGIYTFDSNTPWTLIIILPLALIGAVVVIKAHDHRRSRTVAGTLVREIIGWILYFFAWLLTVGCMAGLVNRASGNAAGVFAGHAALLYLMLAVSMFLALFFAIYMRARTEKSAQWLGKILGFRDFIRYAETDRLRVLQDGDPGYFFRIMPYAYVMGMGKHWAKKFTDIRIEQPAWYSTYDRRLVVFSPLWFNDMTTATARSYSNSFSNLPDSGSHGSFSGGGGGFSGGGFSGGGFGGGGGGAW
ncbi:MAG: DUF2207 domain-containing protein, partial [Eubacterium sp.]|nr:DUF2207 domain-containing protein [Eubacterium sp.]